MTQRTLVPGIRLLTREMAIDTDVCMQMQDLQVCLTLQLSSLNEPHSSLLFFRSTLSLITVCTTRGYSWVPWYWGLT